MRVIDLLNSNFISLTGDIGLNNSINSIFIGDLLSHVLAKASDEDILITVQTNVNTLAVASLINLSLVIFPDGVIVPKDVISRAINENIPLFKTNLSAKEVVLHLTKIGVK